LKPYSQKDLTHEKGIFNFPHKPGHSSWMTKLHCSFSVSYITFQETLALPMSRKLH
jgi:hypothetical protein